MVYALLWSHEDPISYSISTRAAAMVRKTMIILLVHLCAFYHKYTRASQLGLRPLCVGEALSSRWLTALGLGSRLSFTY